MKKVLKIIFLILIFISIFLLIICIINNIPKHIDKKTAIVLFKNHKEDFEMVVDEINNKNNDYLFITKKVFLYGVTYEKKDYNYNKFLTFPKEVQKSYPNTYNFLTKFSAYGICQDDDFSIRFGLNAGFDYEIGIVYIKDYEKFMEFVAPDDIELIEENWYFFEDR